MRHGNGFITTTKVHLSVDGVIVYVIYLAHEVIIGPLGTVTLVNTLAYCII